MKTSIDVITEECACLVAPRTGLTPDALPEKSKIGVSTHSVSSETPHWYILRATYGSERKAYDYLVSKGITAFYPTLKKTIVSDGRRKEIEVSRIPNIFFAHGTEEQLRAFVYDNVNLPFLRFYYAHHREGNILTRSPLILPDRQMESLRIICSSDTPDVLLLNKEVEKFKTGQLVKVVRGPFAGVEGRVARFYGQQRVAVVVDGLLTVATAYVPSAYLVPLKISTEKEIKI